jgi:hypothetical protein
VRTRHWLVLEDKIRAAGSDDDPAAEARALREEGVRVSRNRRAQWVADPMDPQVISWRQGLAGSAEAEARYGG